MPIHPAISVHNQLVQATSQTGAGGGAEAIPAFVGPGTDGFSPSQSLCLPQLAPVPTGLSPVTVWTRKARFTWNRFAVSPVELISGGGINPLRALRMPTVPYRSNTKASRTIAAFLD